MAFAFKKIKLAGQICNMCSAYMMLMQGKVAKCLEVVWPKSCA